MKASPNPKRQVTIEERERDVLSMVIFFVLVLITIPHIFGYGVAKHGFKFIGTGTNIDDYLVYLSWVQQTAQGHFFIRNLFTTDDQPTLLFNLLMSAVGGLERLTHLQPQYVIDITRIAGSVGLMLLIYSFYRFCIPNDRVARITAFGFACFSSGIGWLQWRIWTNDNADPRTPLDATQPEAYTFTSMYLSFLDVIGTMLIIGVLYGMLKCLRTGRIRWAVVAGVCGCVMGDIHSYDVLHVCAAWGLFMLAFTAWRRGNDVARIWWSSLLGLAIFTPSIWYVYHTIRTNPVFKARSESLTLSMPVYYYFIGYGLVFVGAMIAAVYLANALLKARQSTAAPDQAGLGKPGPERPGYADKTPFGAADSTISAVLRRYGWADVPSALFVVCWAVAGFLVIYLPFNFQRKMLMGEHIPLCLLAGWGAAQLTRGINRTARLTVLSVLVAVSFISNVFYIRRDVMHMSHNRSDTTLWPVLSPSFLEVLDYVSQNTPDDAAIMAWPNLAAYIPPLTGRTVWAGHWSETPDFESRTKQIFHEFDVSTPEPERVDFLRSTRTQYILYPTDPKTLEFTSKAHKAHNFVDLAHQTPPYLENVFQDKEVTADGVTIGYTLLKINLPPE